MSPAQARIMRYVIRYPFTWHTAGADVRRTVRSLAWYGVIEWNPSTHQFRLAENFGDYGGTQAYWLVNERNKMGEDEPMSGPLREDALKMVGRADLPNLVR